MRVSRALLAALLAIPVAVGAEPGYTYGTAPFTPSYIPPPAGSYELPPIKTVTDHPVLDEAGGVTSLFAAAGKELSVVAFVYMTCAEATGCPVSTAVLHHLDRAVAGDAELHDRVHLVTVSFDPERDTPATMAAARLHHAPVGDWRFLTTRDQAMLAPLLQDFGQQITALQRADGSATGLFRHVLKVFLLDRQHRIRNSYSTGFLDPALLVNDLRTVWWGSITRSARR